MPQSATDQTSALPRLGAHQSIAGGISKALTRCEAVGGTALQVFVKNNTRWQNRALDEEEVERFREHAHHFGKQAILAHASYLINPASPDEQVWTRSIEGLADDFRRCAILGIPTLVLHPGSHKGEGVENGLRRASEAIRRAFEKVGDDSPRLLLESTAGQGHCLGARAEELGDLLDLLAMPKRLGICLDTCHLFAAGYDLRTERTYRASMQQMDAGFGLEQVQAVHLNDSHGKLDSHRDRHAHIGEGHLGLEAFRLLLNDPSFRHCPMIIETPKKRDLEDDRRNLNLLRSLVQTQATPETSAMPQT